LTRTAERQNYVLDTRISLLESDLDKFEEGMEGIRAELRGLNRIMLGVLVSVTTAAILLALNIALQAAGG